MINQQLSKFATHENSAYPQLWRGCVGAWCPSLGPSGARLHDYSRRNNWATLTNMDTATDWVIDGGAYALDFDGVNDQAIANVVLQGRSTSMTVSLWANLANVSDGGAFFKIGADLYDGFGFGRGSTTFDNIGNNYIGLYEGVAWFSTGYTMATDTWIHVACQITSAGQMLAWVGGVQRAAGPSGMRAIGSYSPSTDPGTTNIGGYLSPFVGGIPRFAQAKLDDVRLYDRVLSDAEMRLLARRRGIAFTPRTRRIAVTEQAATGGATPWLYARRRSQIIGAGGVH